MRYIQGLNSESSSMCDWTRELSASRDLVTSANFSLEDALPSWLDKIVASTNSSRTNTIDSIFALRDFMLQESLSVVKFA